MRNLSHTSTFSDLHYYPFGMVQSDRQFSATDYRYGFNGEEQDSEVKGSQNSINYIARIFDPRIGRFLSVDPLIKQYPWYTPYQFAGNKPIAFIDRDGEEEARPEELAYAILNPVDAMQVSANADKAFEAAGNSGLPGREDGLQDAFRHTYWNALNARDVGTENAAPFATIHETGATNERNDPESPLYDPVAIQMDLHNNDVGRKIGELYPEATDDELAALVNQALANGELQVVTNIGVPNAEKLLGNSTHPNVAPGDPVAQYNNTYSEYNGTEDTKRSQRLEKLPNSGTGANDTTTYYGENENRQTSSGYEE